MSPLPAVRLTALSYYITFLQYRFPCDLRSVGDFSLLPQDQFDTHWASHRSHPSVMFMLQVVQFCPDCHWNEIHVFIINTICHFSEIAIKY